MPLSRRYLRKIYKQLKFRAAWLPTEPLALGDVGIVHRDGRWEQVGTLGAFGIPFTARIDETGGGLQAQTNFGVTVQTGFAGKIGIPDSILPSTSAALDVKLQGVGAFVFSMKDGRQHKIVNMNAVQSAIRERYIRGDWKAEWSVISTLVETDCFSALISQSAEAQVLITGAGDAELGRLSLGDANAQLNVVFQKGSVMAFPSQPGTPLFGVFSLTQRDVHELNEQVDVRRDLGDLTPEVLRAHPERAELLGFTHSLQWDEEGDDEE